MAIDNKPSIPHYQPAPPTKQEFDYVDLSVIDLAKASTPEGRAELAVITRDAMHKMGFIYAINHGLSESEISRIFDIADVPFSQVSDSEKLEYTGNIVETGSDQGYKPRRHWTVDNGVPDDLENYAINRIVTRREHPQALRPLLPEIQAFAKLNHDIVHTMLRILAIGLEIPEETFVKQHNFEADGETYVRFMKYYPRSEEDEQKSKQVWLRGHTDFGTVSILWPQPVTGLQVLTEDGKWQYVRYMENALIINAGDCMELISGGYYKASVHRVIQPAEDQRGYTRLGVFYFSLPDNNQSLQTVSCSPLLERLGIKPKFPDGEAPTAGTFIRARTSAYIGKTNLKRIEKQGVAVEEDVVSGAVVKHYY